VSEPRLDPSDAQVTRHAMGQLAESMAIIRDTLTANGFQGRLLDDMVMAWWTMSINQTSLPDLGELFKGLIDPGGDE
jgi:hypothetical protein